MSNDRWRRLAACLVVAVAWTAFVAACSSSNDSGSSSTEATSASTTSTTPVATTTTSAGEDVSLADGRIVIPAANVGDVDLTRLPVGDDMVTDTPTVGGLDLCSTFPTNGQGANTQGPWFNGDGTWDLTTKLAVLGSVDWPDAQFATTVDGDTRTLAGNNLPVDAQTGTFPVAADDPVAAYDGNQSSIFANDYDITVPANPTAASEPGCVSGEVGFLLDGVVLNSPVDAAGRDAVAWEGQDPCEGHPNDNSGYHYHSVSPCVPDEGTGQSPVVGFALDGYPITGHRGADGQVLTDADLDECHGTTSTITVDGEEVNMYHYAATWEFPYAVGCFHGTSAVQGPIFGGGGPP